MSVTVLSRTKIIDVNHSVSGFLEKNNVVSCLDTGIGSPFIFSVYTDHKPNLLTLSFDDVGNPDWDHSDETRYQKFTLDHAERLVKWFEKSDRTKNYFVHCWAGVSRSGAIGMWIADKLGISHTDFALAHPQCKPNKLVLQTIQAFETYGIEKPLCACCFQTKCVVCARGKFCKYTPCVCGVPG